MIFNSDVIFLKIEDKDKRLFVESFLYYYTFSLYIFIIHDRLISREMPSFIRFLHFRVPRLLIMTDMRRGQTVSRIPGEFRGTNDQDNDHPIRSFARTSWTKLIEVN